MQTLASSRLELRDRTGNMSALIQPDLERPYADPGEEGPPSTEEPMLTEAHADDDTPANEARIVDGTDDTIMRTTGYDTEDEDEDAGGVDDDELTVDDEPGSVQSNRDECKTPTISSESGKSSSSKKPPAETLSALQQKRDSEPTTNSSLSSGKSEDKRVRKFVCRYCHKAFSLMNVLKVHERIHTGEKPYICEICDKAFNQSGSLNRHKNTHLKRSNDNRSYSCHYCPRQFLHSSQLQEHETNEHSVEPNARKSNLIEPARTTHDASGKGLRPSGTTDLPGISELGGTQLGSCTTTVATQPPPLSSSYTAEGVKNNAVSPLSTFAAGLSLLQSAFASPDLMNRNHTGSTVTKSIDSGDTRLNGASSAPMTGQFSPVNLTGCATGIVSNGTQLDSFNLGINQSDLCPSKFPSRTEFEHYLGQHFTQTFGLPLTPNFPNISLDVTSGVRQPRKSTEVIKKGDLRGMSVAVSSKIPITTNSKDLGINHLVNLPDLLDPSNPISSQTPTSSTATTVPSDTLFPGTASAAALTALGQLMLTHQSTGPSIAQSSLLCQTSPAGLLAATAALANPDLLLFPDPGMMPPSPNSSVGSFAHLLLKAMNSMNPHQAASLVANATAAAAVAAAAATGTVTPASQSQSAPAPATPNLPSVTPTSLQPQAPILTHNNPLFPLFHNGTDAVFDHEPTQGLNLALKTPVRLMNSTNSPPAIVTTTNTAAKKTARTRNASDSPEKASSRISYDSNNNNNNNNSNINNNNNSDLVGFHSFPNSLFPINLSWFENPPNPDGLRKPTTASSPSASLFDLRVHPSTIGQTGTDTRKVLFNYPPVCSPGLGDLVGEAKQSTNLAVHGFEPDGFSDPDGSSSTGSMPGGLMMPGKLNNPGTEHSPNSMHSNSRVRQCDLCNKTFNCSSALRIHYRKHSGERPYKCSHCGNAFSQNGTLKRHLQTCKSAATRDRLPGSEKGVDLPEMSASRLKLDVTEELSRGTDVLMNQTRLTHVDEVDGRQVTPPECRSTGTPNARLVSEKPDNPCTPLRTHTKRDHPAEDMTTSAPSDKRSKQQHSQVELLNQCHSINLISDGKPVSKLDHHTVQMLLRHLQLSECLHECADCQIYFVDREMWLRHRDQMHTRAEPDQPFVCAVCSTNLGNRLDFLTHFVQNHRTEPEHSHGLPLPHTVQSFPGQDLLKSNHSDIPALLKPYPNEDRESSRDLLEENLVPQQSNGPVSPQSDPCPSPISFSRSDSQVNESNYPGHSPVQHLSVMTEANSIPSIISTQS